MTPETVRIIGDYEIITEKVDKCPPNWGDIAILPGIFGFIVSATVFAYGFTVWSDVAFAFGTIGACISVLVFFIPSLSTNCGISISLVEKWGKFENGNWNAGSKYHTTSTYQFTKDPERDAKKIQKIIDEKVKYAEDLINKKETARKIEEESEKKQAEESKRCCARYKAVMEKVGKQ